jgi:regulator of nucleoside diphosphate kinase
MSRPSVIHLRRSDADTLTRLVESAAWSRDSRSAELLDEELGRARVVADDALPASYVALDSRVRFQDLQTGEQREITLVLPWNVDSAQGSISVLSPVGSALIGLRVGDDIDWPLPSGRLRRIRVLAVSERTEPLKAV